MALQIRPREETGLERMLGGFGTGLGSGLQTGLEQLAQQNLQDIISKKKQQQTQQGLQALGFDPEKASALSGLDPQSLREVIKSQQRAPQEEAFALALSQLLGGPSVPSDQQVTPLTRVDSTQQALGNLFGIQPPESQAEEVPVVDQVKTIPGKPRLTENQTLKLAELQMRKEELGKKEKSELVKLEKKEEAVAQAETKEYFNEILKLQKTSKESTNTLKKMENLINKGNLPPAALYKLVKDIEEKVPPTHGAAVGGGIGGVFGGPIGAAIGTGIGAVISPLASLVESGIKFIYPDTEQFEKLSKSFISGAKSIFGSRITDQDLKVFLQTIPTLTQTDHGKKQIISNMKLFNDAADIRANAMKKIIKKHGGKRPANLQILVEEQAEKELDKLSNKFIN